MIASITGSILAFEPISNQLQPFAIHNLDEISITEMVTALQSEYEEIIDVSVTNDDFVIASVITQEGNSETFYIHPSSGKKVGNLIEKEGIYKFATNLHRSLFLKSTGRFIVGFVSFLLLLIIITGTILIAKRQGGFKRFFSKVVKEDAKQYYHIQLGKLCWIPLVIITLTGVYLSLEKFSLLPNYKVTHQAVEASETAKKHIETANFSIFQNTMLAEIKTIEFPFSEAPEDYFLLELKNKELVIHQYTGEILSVYEYPIVALASYWSLLLHTGQGSIIWAIVLLLTSFSILYFMYSGFAMTLKRTKKQHIPKNIYKKSTAKFIILVGSETGNTYRFASMFFDALIANGQKAFITQLNTFETYENAEHLIIMTATYGEGEAPSNAKNFLSLLKKTSFDQKIKYSVVGFGSLMYPDYCKYAIDIDQSLQGHKNFEATIPIYKINNQSFTAFENWANAWADYTKIPISIKKPTANINLKKLREFKVIKRSRLNIDDTFTIHLQPVKKQKFQSGDLLSIYPEKDLIERQYSIGKIGNEIILSVKKHEFGICSSYLSQLSENDIVKAKIKRNPEFHFPKYANDIIMIANGTGIAPFLGMINENTDARNLYLFWGTRTKASTAIYKEILDESIASDRLTNLHISYSQETTQKEYVQDAIATQQNFIAQVLQNDGVILICGSVAMQNQVLHILETIIKSKLCMSLSDFENNEQILMDCY
ncbi:oxidoreductase, FAD-binding, putative [Kordia algicida OT-1]|uniref:NADPH--hemoprotein reductase n=1 Tax=Kordia algicida OT-1 TaxID=391587 RepID=A9E747_9FLAO|nr:oxidoreductase, FAD-binding, putative [Kordia algicida OT-1]